MLPPMNTYNVIKFNQSINGTTFPEKGSDFSMLIPIIDELWDYFLFPLLVTMIKLGIEEKPTIRQ